MSSFSVLWVGALVHIIGAIWYTWSLWQTRHEYSAIAAAADTVGKRLIAAVCVVTAPFVWELWLLVMLCMLVHDRRRARSTPMRPLWPEKPASYSAAVEDEQRALGVTPDGIDGPRTREAREQARELAEGRARAGQSLETWETSKRSEGDGR